MAQNNISEPGQLVGTDYAEQQRLILNIAHFLNCRIATFGVNIVLATILGSIPAHGVDKASRIEWHTVWDKPISLHPTATTALLLTFGEKNVHITPAISWLGKRYELVLLYMVWDT